MANIKKLKENGQDIVPITHEQAVLDSNGVTLDSKLNAINNAISRLENNSTSNVPSLEGNALTFGNYTIKYNETDDTLDFLYNGTTEEPEVPSGAKPRIPNNSGGLDSLYAEREGYLVEVYSDKVLFKPRNFISNEYLLQYANIVEL